MKPTGSKEKKAIATDKRKHRVAGGPEIRKKMGDIRGIDFWDPTKKERVWLQRLPNTSKARYVRLLIPLRSNAPGKFFCQLAASQLKRSQLSRGYYSCLIDAKCSYEHEGSKRRLPRYTVELPGWGGGVGFGKDWWVEGTEMVAGTRGF